MISATYFCQVCQDPFEAGKGIGGRQFCEEHRCLAGLSKPGLLRHIYELECKLEQREADIEAEAANG